MVQELTLTLPKIGCQGCMKKVVNALSEIPTVAVVHTDLPTKTVSLRYEGDLVQEGQFEQVLKSIGHIIASKDQREALMDK